MKPYTSHLISIGTAKLSFEGAKLRCKGGGGERGKGTVPQNFLKKKKKWCDFVHSRVFLSTNFVVFFFETFS